MDSKKAILVVDDDPDVVTIIKGILGGGEYGVRSVYSGQQVFTELREQRPDLIILDVKMPEMDGLEVLKRLKTAPETSSIPVILLTGNGQYGDVLTGYRLGTDYYISKPFTGMQLINGIHLILGEGDSQKGISESVA